jgi:hypothetical protein
MDKNRARKDTQNKMDQNVAKTPDNNRSEQKERN